MRFPLNCFTFACLCMNSESFLYMLFRHFSSLAMLLIACNSFSRILTNAIANMNSPIARLTKHPICWNERKAKTNCMKIVIEYPNGFLQSYGVLFEKKNIEKYWEYMHWYTSSQNSVPHWQRQIKRIVSQIGGEIVDKTDNSLWQHEAQNSHVPHPKNSNFTPFFNAFICLFTNRFRREALKS